MEDTWQDAAPRLLDDRSLRIGIGVCEALFHRSLADDAVVGKDLSRHDDDPVAHADGQGDVVLPAAVSGGRGLVAAQNVLKEIGLQILR